MIDKLKPREYNNPHFGVIASGISTSSFDLTGLLAYYTFEETTGNLINQSTSPDSLGSAVDGVVTGTTRSLTGKISNSYGFANSYVDSGNSDYIAIPNALEDAYVSSGALTINVWIYRTSASTNGEFFSLYDSGVSRGIEISSTSSGFVSVSTSNGLDVTSTTSMSAGVWYMVTLTIDLDNSVQTDYDAKIWVNASYNANDDSFTSFGTRTSSIYLGTLSHGNGQGYGFNGRMDELSVWNRPLTSDEIISLYNSGSGLSL